VTIAVAGAAGLVLHLAVDVLSALEAADGVTFENLAPVRLHLQTRERSYAFVVALAGDAEDSWITSTLLPQTGVSETAARRAATVDARPPAFPALRDPPGAEREAVGRLFWAKRLDVAVGATKRRRIDAVLGTSGLPGAHEIQWLPLEMGAVVVVLALDGANTETHLQIGTLSDQAIDVARATNAGQARHADGVGAGSGFALHAGEVRHTSLVVVAARQANVRIATGDFVRLIEAGFSRGAVHPARATALGDALEVVREERHVGPEVLSKHLARTVVTNPLRTVVVRVAHSERNAHTIVVDEIRAITVELAFAALVLQWAARVEKDAILRKSAAFQAHLSLGNGFAEVAGAHAVALPAGHEPAVFRAALVRGRVGVAGPKLIVE
jgi:hypothetical protein